MVFSEVFTMADTSRPRVIDATPSRAMARMISSSGEDVSIAPVAGIFRLARPISTRTAACTAVSTPSTMSLDHR